MNLLKKLKWVVPLVLVMIITFVGIGLAAVIAIDTFDTGLINLNVNLGLPPQVSYADDPSILGGQRDAQISYDDGTDISSLRIDFVDNNVLSFSQGSGNRAIAILQYDGFDGTGGSGSMDLDYMGLGNEDITDDLTNDSFILRILDNNLPIQITFQIYTDENNWSQTQFLTPGLILGDVVDIVIPFDSFIDQEGTTDFEDVGAIQLTIDGTIYSGSDLSLDFFEADSVRDFGDLPEDATNYVGLTLLPTGARHIPNGLRLGPNLDAHLDTEVDGFPNARAGMDQAISPGGDDGIPDGGPNDEDGVTRDMTDNWVPDASVDLNVEVYGCTGTCYLNGWIDWNGDGDFADSDDQIFSDQTVDNNTINILSIQVPASGYTQGSPVFSRFRLCTASGPPPDGCNSLTGETTSGEVEDYWWDFDEPNAISLTNLEAKNNSPIIIAAAGALLLLASGGAVLAYKRRRA